MTLKSKLARGKATSESRIKPMSKPKDTLAPAVHDSVPIINSARATIESATNTFPDLTTIGNAFKLAISYINSQDYPNLEAEAQNWLTRAGRDIIESLGDELRNLHTNKDNQFSLPVYALDPQAPLSLFTAAIPYALIPYHDQFEDYLQQLLKACGLDAKTSFFTIYDGSGKINVKIMFLNLPKGMRTKTVGNLVFNADFQNDFFGTVKGPKPEE